MVCNRGVCEGSFTIAVIGLGYVGLPLAVALSDHFQVIGFDLNAKKIVAYQGGVDVTNEVGDERVANSDIYFTSNEIELEKAGFYIVAVPTPIHSDHTPDLSPVTNACKMVGEYLSKNNIVVFESTVYPGVTEEICVPILERVSGLRFGEDFKVGYSPERINPGDKIHTVDQIKKIVSASDPEALERVAFVYDKVTRAGIYRAESIKVAEAAKVIENSQRDINIAFMNELSIIFNKLGINTQQVLNAAMTKWNFIPFFPGLVGGHCIGVDPYYLTYKAEQIGYHPEVILAGRRINDSMGKYIAENTVKQLIRSDRQVKNAKVLIMGFTFKENVADTRNTKVIDIVNELEEYGVDVYLTDPIADGAFVQEEYGVELLDYESVSEVDAILVAVAHDEYKTIPLKDLKKKFSKGTPVLIDIKALYTEEQAQERGILYWSL